MIKINKGTLIRLESLLYLIIKTKGEGSEEAILKPILNTFPKHSNYILHKFQEVSIIDILQEFNSGTLIHKYYLSKRKYDNEERIRKAKNRTYTRESNPRGFFGLYSYDVIEASKNLKSIHSQELCFSLTKIYLLSLFANNSIDDCILGAANKIRRIDKYITKLRNSGDLDYSFAIIMNYLMGHYNSLIRDNSTPSIFFRSNSDIPEIEILTSILNYEKPIIDLQ